MTIVCDLTLGSQDQTAMDHSLTNWRELFNQGKLNFLVFLTLTALADLIDLVSLLVVLNNNDHSSEI